MYKMDHVYRLKNIVVKMFIGSFTVLVLINLVLTSVPVHATDDQSGTKPYNLYVHSITMSIKSSD